MRLVATCAVLIAATAPNAAAAPLIEQVHAVATASSATISWQTGSATRGRVAYGVGGLYLWTALEATASTAHAVTLPDLNAATTYAFRIDVAGATSSGTLTTDARGTDVRFGTSGTRVTANGSLLFPILSYEQCADTIGRALAIGINMFVQVPYTGCAHPAGVTPPYLLSDDYGGQRGAGWYLPDEPDGWGIPPDRMPKLPAAGLRVLGISQHFYSRQAKINDGFDRNDYKRFAALADFVGFDMYPIVKFCGRVPLLDVFRSQRELMTIYAPNKPTFQWIETSKMTGECPSLAITPAIVQAETWLAIAGGACGIGFFTNSWTEGIWNRWDFDPGVESELAPLVARIQRLAPALCAQYGDVVPQWNGTVAASSRSLNGALYVIAVNSGAKATAARFTVAGLAGRTLTVLDENRTLRPRSASVFSDRFDPYAVHVYVAPPG